jgi:crotonobetainyl-CoA:carnitine CoA-transferase CaiB-like acyl-CoA transferase
MTGYAEPLAAGGTRTFAFLERLLPADFSTRGDLYTHRVTLAALLAPWFARRTVADLAAAFAGTSVPWTHAGQVNTALPMPPDPGAAGSRYGADGNGRLTLSRLPG